MGLLVVRGPSSSPAGPRTWVQHSSGEGLNWSVPPSIERRLAEPAVDRAGRPGDVAQVVAPLADGDRLARAVGDVGEAVRLFR